MVFILVWIALSLLGAAAERHPTDVTPARRQLIGAAAPAGPSRVPVVPGRTTQPHAPVKRQGQCPVRAGHLSGRGTGRCAAVPGRCSGLLVIIWGGLVIWGGEG